VTPLLLERLLAAPGDDTLRAVIADELTGLGDPRGELMALQCKGPLDQREQRHEAKLLKKHGLALCGALAEVVEPRGLEVRRGVVTGVRFIDAKPAELRAALAEPLGKLLRWVDVEALAPGAVPDVLGLLPWLTGVGGVAVDSLGRLLRSHGSRLERLGVVGTAKYQLELHPDVRMYVSSTNLPALRSLRLGGRLLLASLLPFLDQLPALESLSVANLRQNDRLVDGELAFADWVPALERTTLRAFELREDEGSGFWSTKLGWVVRFTRDERGQLSRMEARFHKYPARIVAPYERLAQGLRRWMGRLTEVHVSGLTLEPHQRAELEAFFSAVPASKRQLG